MKRGIIITIVVLLAIFMSMVVMGFFLYFQITREPHIPNNAFLKIELTGDIVDNDNSAFSKQTTIRDLWYHIQRAKIDNRIEGILLKVSFLNSDFAKVEELGQLIKDFKNSGKMTVAYIEGGGIREYYLASFADKIYLFNSGQLFLNGLAIETMFLKNTLSKLGIEAEMFHIGEYKTAGNIFTKDRLTPAHKESLEKLIEDIFNHTLHQIAANRNLDFESVKHIFDEPPVSSSAYLGAKLIDGLCYEDELLKNTGYLFPLVEFNTYKETTKPQPYKGTKKIAVIFASGEIHSGRSGGKSLFGGEVLGSDTIAAQLEAARLSSSIKGVVLRIDSPGGSAPASEVIRREAELLAREKPLVISMSGMAASGGYWISMSSPIILAQPQTITGSIGVVTGKFVLKGLYDKIGINKEVVKTTKYADLFSDYRLFSPEEKQKITLMMQDVYRQFLEKVAANRKMKVEEVDKIAGGRIWSGSTARDLKLVDKLGGLTEAINETKKLARIPLFENVGLKIYPGKKTMMDFILELIGTRSQSIDPINSLESKLSLYKRFFPALLVPFKLAVR
jgi:protease-4